MTDCKNLELARQWAADVDADRETLSQDTIDAAADLISSLPDEWVDAKELREVIDKWEGREITSDAHLLYREVEALLPTPLAPESASPRPEDVPVGEPWQVEVGGDVAIGYRNDPMSRLCWAVVYSENASHEWLYDSEVTLIARLVPEQEDA